MDKIDGKFVPPSLPYNGKLARFGFCAVSSMNWGDGGSKIATLDKIDGKFVPPWPPNQGSLSTQNSSAKPVSTVVENDQGWEIGAFWLLRGFILDFFWGGGRGGGGDNGCLLFHFILSKTWSLAFIFRVGVTCGYNCKAEANQESINEGKRVLATVCF